MLGTIRTIQHQAGQALPTCVQPNHNLMNTLGAVCSKLLPVGDRATGISPSHSLPSHFAPSSSPHLFCNSCLAHPPELILAPALRSQLWHLIKSRFISWCCQHSNTAPTACVCGDNCISYMWGDVDWQLKCLYVKAKLFLFEILLRALFPMHTQKSIPK